ncbi:MAG: alcohol dehydrogenase catalytic domain-containing protein [Cyanobacteria bacterium]|nr:alcohol dehydrogenase catalytic domain-containing protein [Cyanobacteriota bacterium]MDA1019986.1 alcohol dehydrogenase catalytic domain-containing protein [Cyanobacteriota bacterium]
MKALIYQPNSPQTSFLELSEVEKPLLKDNNAIVKVTGVGVCGSDLLKLNRALIKPGTILGHEMVGIIDEISETMSLQYGFKKGDRILSSHHVPCLECDYCLRGKESLCTKFKSTNFNPGAFCEYLELSEDHLKHTVQKIPEGMTDEVASFTEPVACCIKAVRHCERSEAIQTKVLVIGLGSIGLIMGQVIRHNFPNSQITGLDLQETRLKLALELGFDQSLSALQTDNIFDIIFLCAGANTTVELASKHAANGATIVVFSSTPAETSFANNDIYYKELTVRASYSPNLDNLKEALNLLAKGVIKVDNLITNKSKLSELGTKIQNCKSEQGIKTYLKP